MTDDSSKSAVSGVNLIDSQMTDNISKSKNVSGERKNTSDESSNSKNVKVRRSKRNKVNDESKTMIVGKLKRSKVNDASSRDASDESKNMIVGKLKRNKMNDDSSRDVIVIDDRLKDMNMSDSSIVESERVKYGVKVNNMVTIVDKIANLGSPVISYLTQDVI